MAGVRSVTLLGMLGAVLVFMAFVVGATATAEPDLAGPVLAGRIAPALAGELEVHGEAEAIVSFAPGADFDATVAAIAALGDVIATWPYVSTAHVIVDAGAALRVTALPGVLSLAANTVHEAALDTSGPLVNQPIASVAGYDGEGVTVAVLDTGAECARLPEVDGECPVVWAEDFAEDDGSEDDGQHGTNVSAIVLGVAPAAKIAALDVFIEEDGRHGAPTSAIIGALNAVVERADELNIVAVNMSLGDATIRHILACPVDGYANAFAALRANGIVPVLAAGNNPYSAGLYFNGVASPACTPGALSVGAVYDRNWGRYEHPAVDPIDIFGLWPRSSCVDEDANVGLPACFSQSGPTLGVWAPGVRIDAGGYEFTGTSMAAPHVAGAVAVIAAAAPGSTVDQREAAIVNSGQQVYEPRNGTTRRMLELCGALSAVGAACGGASLDIDWQAVPAGAWRYYWIDVPAGVGLLSVSTAGSTTNLDLYVRSGSRPTETAANCAQTSAATNETCVIASPAAGRWWVGVRGVENAEFSITSATANVNLVARARLPFLAGDSVQR